MHGIGRQIGWMVVALSIIAAAGCRTVPKPRSRLGGLPFPGLATLFTTADPDHLGEHASGLCDHCEPPHRPAILGDEVARGMIYTRKAGFVDLSHLRDTADWTYYVYRHVRPAIEDGRDTLTIDGIDRSRWHLTFDYTPLWPEMLALHGDALIDETANHIAQQVGYAMLTWHEIITGFGYASTGVWPETRSAFTYDDIVSHAIGTQLAGEAIRVGGCYDEAIAAALARRLKKLQAVEPQLTRAAVEMVRGDWWEPEQCLRYQYDVGLASGAVTPWLVAGMSYDGQNLGEPMMLATLHDVMGYDLSGLYRVELEPRVLEGRPIRKVLDESGDRIRPAEHFPRIIEHLRHRAKANYGADCDQP